MADIRNPDLPTMFVHFTGRVRGADDPVPDGLPSTPEERLVRILVEGRLLPSTRFTHRPAVCVSESSPDAAEAFFSRGVNVRGPYDPWALLLNRNACIESGFRPVVHASNLEIEGVKLAAREDMRVETLLGRMVRYEPPHRDWLHEREWRRAFRESVPEARLSVSLHDLVRAIIVPESGWSPPLDRTFAPACQRLERIHWDGQELRKDGYLELPV